MILIIDWLISRKAGFLKKWLYILVLISFSSSICFQGETIYVDYIRGSFERRIVCDHRMRNWTTMIQLIFFSLVNRSFWGSFSGQWWILETVYSCISYRMAKEDPQENKLAVEDQNLHWPIPLLWCWRWFYNPQVKYIWGILDGKDGDQGLRRVDTDLQLVRYSDIYASLLA